MELNNQQPLDTRRLEYDRFLANLQGNILKGHGRDNTVHLFIRFKRNKKDPVFKWIKTFAEKKVTSFKEQLRQREVYKRNGVSGGLFAGIYLTAAFYKDFEVDASVLPNHEAFSGGMKARQEILKDDMSDWEEDYNEPVHAMVLLAHADLIALNTAAREVCELLEDPNANGKRNVTGSVVASEYGNAIRNANGDGLEHFGYVDGISQPIFLKDEMEDYERNVPEVYFNPFASLSLVLVEDVPAKQPECFGSYFVYRKLEQNVKEFKRSEHKLAHDLKLAGEDAERVGAMIIGRFEDGTPLTLSGEDKMISSGIMNNFTYAGDPAGLKCPFHAHIRKTNPRRPEEETPGVPDADRRMARRGITYGHRNVSTTIENHFVQMPTSGVGLLFMSFQADIQKQFEHIQARWANDADHPKNDTGVDLIIGPEKGNRTSRYPTKYDDPAAEAPLHSFKNFVCLKGGEYFFAPSIPFLKSLAPAEE